MYRGNLMGEDVHAMFVSQGLRHLVVVNDASWPQGMITRHDLDVAAGPGGYWRRSKVCLVLPGLLVSQSASCPWRCCCLCPKPAPMFCRSATERSLRELLIFHF